MHTVLTLLTFLVFGQEVISFPGKPTTEKALEPVHRPDKCSENELYYPPRAPNTEWICDCGPGFIYYPPKKSCHLSHRQGPCARGQALMVPEEKIVPECKENPCREGFAQFKGRCYEMGQPNGPCPPIAAGGGIFEVNATTLKVGCIKGTEPLSLFNLPKNCPPGSKRAAIDMCRDNWNV